MTTYSLRDYQPDILGTGYEQLTLNFPNDSAGQVTATLVRKKSDTQTSKAVLYIHGFIDYFFQTEMAAQFNQHGYNFYALDLRKYGRSILPHQKPYDVLDLAEYNAEITEALNIIRDEGHRHIVLSGHSTGGLITTLYAAHHLNHESIKALWVNSPFYDFNMHVLKKKIALPNLSKLGKKFPQLQFPSGLNPFYTQSLHRDLRGEWNFDLNLKPKTYPKVSLSFIHAIHEAQKELQQGIEIDIPTLVMHSDRTTFPKRFNKDAQSSDVILDVKTIAKYAKKLKGDIHILPIKDGLHDLVLSRTAVRMHVYQSLFQWLAQKGL